MAFPTSLKPSAPPPELPGELKCVGSYVVNNPEDGMYYQPVEITLRDGKVSNVRKLERAFNETDAVNECTNWLDLNLYDD